MFLRINEIKFDTLSETFIKTNCFATIEYYPQKKYIKNVTVTSTLFNVKKSKRNWKDMASSYYCDLVIDNLSTLSEIADSIKDKEWEYEDKNKVPVERKIKEEVLNIMYNAKELLAEYMVNKFTTNNYKHISKNGWVNLFKLKEILKEKEDIEIPMVYLCDLPNYDKRFGVCGDSRINRRMMLYDKYKTVKVRIDTIFDNAKSMIGIAYQPERKYIKGVYAISNLSMIKGSKLYWQDMASYGACNLQINSFLVLKQIAETIKDKKWTLDTKDMEVFEDESMKNDILDILLNAKQMYADFLYERLNYGKSWVKLRKFEKDVEDVYNIDVSRCYTLEILKTDERFDIRGKSFDDMEIRIK